jgi:hypothetical protein
MNKCIICDLDGTLSLFDREKKNPYNRDFENDECSKPVKWMLEQYNITHPENVIFFLSGRDEKYRDQTLLFLQKYFNHPEFSYALIMRKEKDNRKDVIVKEEFYNEYIRDKYRVEFVIDDRLQVCRLWYSLGLFVFNVNQGLKEF